jgi:carboxymethylenebutenolidase
VVYEGAPHSFFDRTFTEHQEACADAWRQMLDFVKENLNPG